MLFRSTHQLTHTTTNGTHCRNFMPHQSLALLIHARHPMSCSSPCAPATCACCHLSHRHHAQCVYMVFPSYCLVARCRAQEVVPDDMCQKAGILCHMLHWQDGLHFLVSLAAVCTCIYSTCDPVLYPRFSISSSSNIILISLYSN